MGYYILKSYRLKVEPSRVFEALRAKKSCFFLDSSLNSNPMGRYSFLGIDPFYILESRNNDPLPRLRELLDSYKLHIRGCDIPFLGGAVGYMGYDLGFILEKKVKSRPKPGPGIPDCSFGFYNSSVIIDHHKGLIYIFACGLPEKRERLARALSESNFRKLYKLLCGMKEGSSGSKKVYHKEYSSELNSNFTRGDYISAVKAAKEYIRRGDIYQVNLSQGFSAKTDMPAFHIYERLRRISPSSFSAYLDCGEYQILSSSPESFLRVRDNALVTTRPMKGTRPRSRNRPCDIKLKKELLESEKDKAELMMIVDLERNDLGRVCDYDSIGVSRRGDIEEYSTVFQTTATIRGRLHKDKDRVDLLRACFPGGSITGCPKIRAMEVIEELEPSRRSIYTGSLGYLSFSGDMDSNILIRTILKKGSYFYFGVGGGIVADSRPEDEYRETLVKARAMIRAIKGY